MFLTELTDFGTDSDEISGTASELPGVKKCVEELCQDQLMLLKGEGGKATKELKNFPYAISFFSGGWTDAISQHEKEIIQETD